MSSGTSRSVLRSEPLAGEREAPADEIGELALAAHAHAEPRLVVLAAADLADDAHHVRRAQRVMRREPVAEERRDLERQPQHRPGGVPRSGRRRRLEDRLEVAVGELRDHRRDVDAHRHAGVAQRLDHLQPAVRCGRARIELARQLAVEHRDRDEHADETLRRHRGQQVEVALDQHALGRDRQRMVAFGEHFDDGARDLPLALDRLVRDRCWRRARSARSGSRVARAPRAAGRRRWAWRRASSRNRGPAKGRDTRASAARSSRRSRARSPGTD